MFHGVFHSNVLPSVLLDGLKTHFLDPALVYLSYSPDTNEYHFCSQSNFLTFDFQQQNLYGRNYDFKLDTCIQSKSSVIEERRQMDVAFLHSQMSLAYQFSWFLEMGSHDMHISFSVSLKFSVQSGNKQKLVYNVCCYFCQAENFS